MLIKYAMHNKLYAVVIAYFSFSIVLRKLGVIDITPPCVFTYLFSIECWGCGLTRAVIELLNMNFRLAWEYNPVVFFVLPFFVYFILIDYIKFRSKTTKGKHK